MGSQQMGSLAVQEDNLADWPSVPFEVSQKLEVLRQTHILEFELGPAGQTEAENAT